MKTLRDRPDRDPDGSEWEDDALEVEVDPPEGVRAPATGARKWLRELGWLVGAEAGTVLALVVVLQLWRAHFRIAFYNGVDASISGGFVKTVLQHGWYYDNSNLGFPGVSNARDRPLDDVWHFTAVRLFGIVSHNWGLAMNLFYLGSFILITATAYLALRTLGVRPVVAAGGGIVMAFLPYHFWRNETHLLLTDYSAIPLVVALIVGQLSDRPWLRLRGGRASPRYRVIAAFVIVIWASGTGTYYAVLAAILIALTGLFASATRRRLEPALSAIVLVGVMAVVLGAQLLPTVLYAREHGRNHAFDRVLVEQDNLSLRPLEMFLPIPTHRIHILGAPVRDYVRQPHPSERGQELGLVSALGLGGLLLLALSPLVGGRGLRDPTDRSLAMIAIIGFVMAVTAGAGTALAIGGLTEIRAWNRISVFLAFVGLAAAARFLDKFLRKRKAALPVVALIVVACVAVAVFDQTSPADVPTYDRAADQLNLERDFVHKIETTLGARAAILQLPYAKYPEVGDIENMGDYAHLHGYLASDTLRWSYGALKGRPNWQDGQKGLSVPDQLRRARAAGFTGIWVDRKGYENPEADIERELRACVGPPLFVSGENRRALYDLRADPHC